MKQTLDRCHRLLVAMKAEIENLSKVPQDERARMMAVMKINLVSYIQSIWPDGLAFEADIAALEATQQAVAADTTAKSPCRSCAVLDCQSCNEHCTFYPPRE